MASTGRFRGFLAACIALCVSGALARGQDEPAAVQNPLAPELVTGVPAGDAWLNTDRPLRLSDELKGHVVLLDFWTYCCINCMHILPDLAYLEEKYADQPFVVIGVHSAKFDAEGQRASIRAAMFRYDIHHPVLIDTGMSLWNKYGVRSWPTFVLIGPDGRLIGTTSGEGKREILDRAIELTLALGRDAGTLAERRVAIRGDEAPRAATGLAYPGKVLGVPADPAQNRAGYLFISDSSHNRVIAATWPDAEGHCSIVDIFGSGEAVLRDGQATDAGFHDPQGMAFDPARGRAGTLYVADTNNHAIRSIDMATSTVTTLVGTGEQGFDYRGGGQGREQTLSSPWDLALTPDGRTLYVAMAGTHQLWSVDVFGGGATRAIAGGSGENLFDGSASMAMLAQPSGLALSSDGKRLYFADSESSSIRLLDLEQNQVGTIIGAGLFEFGDTDGAYPDARLQHCIGLTLYPTPAGERLLVADTYNDKIKIVHPGARTSEALLGVSRGVEPGPGELDLAEPAGLSFVPASADGARAAALFIADTNNHRVVLVDPATRAYREIIIDGLVPPAPEGGVGVPDVAGALGASAALRPGQGATLMLDAELPEGASVNAEAPMTVRVWRLPRPGERMPPRVIIQRTVEPSLPLGVEIPAGEVRDGALWLVELSFAWCEHGQDATCRPGEIAWRVEVGAGDGSSAGLRARVE